METSESFEDVVQRHQGIIYKVANLYCRNEADKQDLVQEILVQLWRSFDKYDNSYKYSTWIYRIALNVAISFYRKVSAKKNQTVPLEETQIVLYAPPTTESNGQLLLLEKFINELKELDKALMLLYLEEKSHKQISDILGISASNVSTKINRIKEKLKEKFEEQKTI
jgi:RNA polymerase sigma-70 factor (ECF subfamily)